MQYNRGVSIMVSRTEWHMSAYNINICRANVLSTHFLLSAKLTRVSQPRLVQTPAIPLGLSIT